MLIIKKLETDLLSNRVMRRVNAVQFDENSRGVELSVYAGSVAWEPPEGVEMAVSYRKPDGTSGLYDTLPDGTTKACTVSGNVITALFAPQMLTVSGVVTAAVILYSGTSQLATFQFCVVVEPNPSAGGGVSNDYYNYQSFAALNAVIGNLADLQTTAKNNLVAAINEAAKTGGNSSGGQPTAVSYAADMTDIEKLYLYAGTESGWTAGHWYYYANGKWNDGGQYGGSGQNIEISRFEHEDGTGGVNISIVRENADGTVEIEGASVCDGKSAYAYAVDGGYTGTEEEFAEKLAEEQNAVYYTAQTLTDEQKAQARENIGAQAEVGTKETETLETAAIAYVSSYNDGNGSWVDDTTFEYTETTTYYNYGPVIAKQSTLVGGVLRVEWDVNVAINFNLSLYLFDSAGNPYRVAGYLEDGTIEKWAGELYEPVYGEPGTVKSWGSAAAPFSVQIPDGCTVMCAIRYVPAEAGPNDGPLGDDAQAFQSWVLGGGITFTVEKAFSGYVEKDFGAENANRYLVTDENGNVTVGGIVGEEEETSDIPDYITTEISEVAATLKAVQEAHPKSATFAFLTDHHFHYNSEHLVRHNLHAIDKISEQCHVEFAAYGGDNIAENGDGVVALRKVKYFGNILRDYNIRKAVAMGNHDDNSLAGYQSDTGKYLVDYAVPQSQFYAHLYRPNENVFNIGMDSNRDKLYFYIDLPSQQIRVIFLNVIDIPILDDGSGGLVYTGIHDSGYSNEQLNWVASDALNFSDKKNPEQWDVIVIQHFVDCPYITDFNSCVTQEHGGEAMYNIFRAFRRREAYSSVISEGDFAHDVSCDFTDAKAGFICSISGHSHADRHVMYDGVLYISTISAGLNGAGVSQGTDGITYYKTPDTAEESGFDFLTFDKDTKTIYATRFGAGVDRVISWESGEVEEEDDGNLFVYGTAEDYVRYDTAATTGLTVVDGQYVRKADMGSNGAFFFNMKAIENPGVTMTLSATFVSEDETLTPIARFGLRLFDESGEIITTGMSSDWKYNATYKAFYQDTDNVTFTLPDTAVSFYVGFLFSVSTVGKYVRVENIMLTAES